MQSKYTSDIANGSEVQHEARQWIPVGSTQQPAQLAPTLLQQEIINSQDEDSSGNNTEAAPKPQKVYTEQTKLSKKKYKSHGAVIKRKRTLIQRALAVNDSRWYCTISYSGGGRTNSYSIKWDGPARNKHEPTNTNLVEIVKCLTSQDEEDRTAAQDLLQMVIDQLPGKIRAEVQKRSKAADVKTSKRPRIDGESGDQHAMTLSVLDRTDPAAGFVKELHRMRASNVISIVDHEQMFSRHQGSLQGNDKLDMKMLQHFLDQQHTQQSMNNHVSHLEALHKKIQHELTLAAWW